MTTSDRPELVRVLLSTWNGERFVRAQIESVLAQDHAPLELVVRDDGSRDGTPAILQEYADRHPDRVRFIPGANLGMVGSYFGLIRDFAAGADVLAFADLDDVWHPDKIRHAVAALRKMGPGPALYTGRLRFITETGEPAGLSNPPRRPMQFRNALVENVASGATMVMNAAASNLLLELRDTSGVKWPDWWFYLVVSAFGDVVYDEVPHIDYRLHAGNAVGMPSGWRRLRQVWRLLGTGEFVAGLFRQAEGLRRNYGERMPADRRAALDAFLARPRTLLGRVRHALSLDVYRQRAPEEVVLRAALALSPGQAP